MGKLKDVRISKSMKIHELNAQAAEGPWIQQQYVTPYQQTAYHNPSPQSEIPEAAFHHMHTVWSNSVNKQEDSRHIWPLFVSTQYNALGTPVWL